MKNRNEEKGNDSNDHVQANTKSTPKKGQPDGKKVMLQGKVDVVGKSKSKLSLPKRSKDTTTSTSVNPKTKGKEKIEEKDDEFCVGDKIVRFTPEDVALIFGLPLKGETVVLYPKSVGKSNKLEFMKTYFGIEDEIKLLGVKNEITSVVKKIGKEDDFVRFEWDDKNLVAENISGQGRRKMVSSLILHHMVLLVFFFALTANAIIKVFDVRKFGAVRDGKTDCNKAFLQAFEMACAWEGDAVVYIPIGTYYAGLTIFNSQNDRCKFRTVRFQVEGLVKAPTDLSGDSWIKFRYIKQMTLDRGGIFNGQGASAWPNTLQSAVRPLNFIFLDI
ncbi:hypothetical protein IFM89_017906 [Coptis chinensis]|uniref:Rhamnogalacturonase A/B/Epimerase-like pectate lyase domain-containing protein n=1 Tax=Coptis chinensis TaxID=261450 RepID=A0A835I403_9MAGN|nr:hypothetical protein IFM89_017906 [Coptis chinensis]